MPKRTHITPPDATSDHGDQSKRRTELGRRPRSPSDFLFQSRNVPASTDNPPLSTGTSFTPRGTESSHGPSPASYANTAQYPYAPSGMDAYGVGLGGPLYPRATHGPNYTGTHHPHSTTGPGAMLLAGSAPIYRTGSSELLYEYPNVPTTQAALYSSPAGFYNLAGPQEHNQGPVLQEVQYGSHGAINQGSNVTSSTDVGPQAFQDRPNTKKTLKEIQDYWSQHDPDPAGHKHVLPSGNERFHHQKNSTTSCNQCRIKVDLQCLSGFENTTEGKWRWSPSCRNRVLLYKGHHGSKSVLDATPAFDWAKWKSEHPCRDSIPDPLPGSIDQTWLSIWEPYAQQLGSMPPGARVPPPSKPTGNAHSHQEDNKMYELNPWVRYNARKPVMACSKTGRSARLNWLQGIDLTHTWTAEVTHDSQVIMTCTDKSAGQKPLNATCLLEYASWRAEQNESAKIGFPVDGSINENWRQYWVHDDP